jgi:Fic family protein
MLSAVNKLVIFGSDQHFKAQRKLLEATKSGAASYRLFEMLPMMPRFTVERVKTALGTTFPTANAAVKTLEDLGLITETTGNKKRIAVSATTATLSCCLPKWLISKYGEPEDEPG